MRLRFCLALAGACAIPLTASVSRAQTSERPENDSGTVNVLETITVTATRTPRSTFEVPAMVDVVDAGSPENAGASRVKDLLQDVPGLEFSGSARRNGQNMVMRGFDTDGLLVLLDGVRQRFESAHDGKFFVDPSLLKTVEVVRGPSSALYGSGGLGGVVAFETASASDLLSPGESLGAQTTAGQSSVNDEWRVSQSVFTRSGDVDLLLNGTVRNSGDIDLGDGNTLVAEDRVRTGLAKLDWAINEDSDLTVNLQGLRNDAEEPNNPQTTANSDLVDKETDSYQGSLRYRFNPSSSDLVALTAQVYHSDTDVDEREVDSRRRLSRRMTRTGFSVENQSVIGSRGPLTTTLTYGGEIYTEQQDGSDTRTETGEAGAAPDAETDFRGVFLQAEFAYTPGVIPGQLMLVPGVRYDEYESDNESGLELDENEVSPRVGLTYRPNDWLMVFGSYADAFRAPTITEAFTTGTHFVIPGQGVNRFVPNPDLRPESSQTLEYGLGLQFADLWQAGDGLEIKAARFETDGEDFIDTTVNFVPFPCCGTTTATNVPDAELWGYDVQARYRNDRWRMQLGYSVVNGDDADTGEYLDTVSPGTLTASVGVNLPEWGSVAGWRARFTERHDRVNDESEERAGFGVHDIYYQWTPAAMGEQLSVNVGIDNLFDKNYSRVFAGSPEPGRNVNVQLRYRWNGAGIR